MASASETTVRAEPTLPFKLPSAVLALLDEPAVELELLLLLLSVDGWHASVLQSCCTTPSQPAPPSDGAGLVHVRVCVPTPHDAEHADQVDQTPLTVSSHATFVFVGGSVVVPCVHESTERRSYCQHLVSQSEQSAMPILTPPAQVHWAKGRVCAAVQHVPEVHDCPDGHVEAAGGGGGGAGQTVKHTSTDIAIREIMGG